MTRQSTTKRTTSKQPAAKPSTRPVVEALSTLLASSYTLYLKTQNYHWNVTGPMFTTLHTLFETQYTELAVAVDEIAERIRSVGAFAPGSFAEFRAHDQSRRRRAPEGEGDDSHPRVRPAGRGRSRSAVIEAAESVSDQATADLATRRLDVHEKNAWMLRSHLE